MNYSEAIEYLYSSRPPFHQVGAAAYKPGPDNMLRLMEEAGNPHQQLRAIHVAGTNGKGSTCHLMAAALQVAGLRVGLYTSPHLLSPCERIRINGQPIPEADVADFVTRHKELLDHVQPSFFETMTMMAFCYFVKQQVDIAVVEVGLGGRLDCTNILTPILSVITNIGLDHTEFLGTTLAEIAAEKSGIIKPGVPVVIGETQPETEPVFLSRAKACNAPIWFADQCEYLRRCRMRFVPECELRGIYQQHNLQTAYVALKALNNLQFTIHHSQIAEGFAHVCTLTGLRGRWETLQKQPLILCDTGHNSHGIRYVTQQLHDLPNPHIYIVFGMVNDKDTDIVMQMLPDGDRFHYIFTRPSTQRARSAREMLALWSKNGIAIEDPQEAITYAITHASADDAIFIGGSNYLVSDALSRFTH